MKQKDNVLSNITRDKAFMSVIVILSILSMIPLFLILYYIFVNGLPVLSANFFTQIPPEGQGKAEIIRNGLQVGGVLNAILGTFYIVSVGSLMAIPFGIIVGIYLAENRHGKFANIVQVAVDMIQGVPSIIFGIIINLWMVKTLKSYSGFAGSVSLALMMLPLVIKNTEETLKLVPHSLKEAALALGTPYYRVVFKIMLPAGISGIASGILLGVTRIAGETAPLLFTSFGNQYISGDMSQQMETLPTLIFKNYTSPYQNMVANAWGASVILIVIVLVLNIITKMVVNKWKVKY